MSKKKKTKKYKKLWIVPNAFLIFSIPRIEILYSYQTPYITQKLFPGVEIEKNYFSKEIIPRNKNITK